MESGIAHSRGFLRLLPILSLMLPPTLSSCKRESQARRAGSNFAISSHAECRSTVWFATGDETLPGGNFRVMLRSVPLWGWSPRVIIIFQFQITWSVSFCQELEVDTISSATGAHKPPGAVEFDAQCTQMLRML